MSIRTYRKHATATAAALIVTGCGGGGGGDHVQSTPPPVATPTPTPSPTPSAAAIDILASPATQELAALTSSGSSSDLRIRYDAATSHYEISVANAGWQGLRPSSTYHSIPEHYFSFGPANQEGFFQVAATSKDPAPAYQYSSLAVWGEGVGAYWDDSNYTAFGVPTAAASMPVTGTASYQGLIAGDTDVLEMDFLIGAKVAATINGSVDLTFNFGTGTLAGSMHPTLTTFGGQTDLGNMSFVNTVYSTGSNTFSGKFDTPVAGANSFDGLFTGPSAQELIGRWTFPFIYSGDGAIHSASGAWIAKDEP